MTKVTYIGVFKVGESFPGIGFYPKPSVFKIMHVYITKFYYAKRHFRGLIFILTNNPTIAMVECLYTDSDTKYAICPYCPLPLSLSVKIKPRK